MEDLHRLVPWKESRSCRSLYSGPNRFLVFFLRRDKDLSLSAIEGYHSALPQVFDQESINLTLFRELSMLFRSFEKPCPPKEVSPSQWNVSMVLSFLRGGPFEPLKKASDRILTLKAVFPLASAKRVGELHAWSAQVGHSEGWRSLSFSFVPNFVAKSQNPSIPDHRFDGFSIPLMKISQVTIRRRCSCVQLELCASTSGGRFPLCSSDQGRLFLSTGRSKKNFSKNTFSF